MDSGIRPIGLQIEAAIKYKSSLVCSIHQYVTRGLKNKLPQADPIDSSYFTLTCTLYQTTLMVKTVLTAPQNPRHGNTRLWVFKDICNPQSLLFYKSVTPLHFQSSVEQVIPVLRGEPLQTTTLIKFFPIAIVKNLPHGSQLHQLRWESMFMVYKGL